MVGGGKGGGDVDVRARSGSYGGVYEGMGRDGCW
jgi:hypothetical protein